MYVLTCQCVCVDVHPLFHWTADSLNVWPQHPCSHDVVELKLTGSLRGGVMLLLCKPSLSPTPCLTRDVDFSSRCKTHQCFLCDYRTYLASLINTLYFLKKWHLSSLKGFKCSTCILRILRVTVNAAPAQIHIYKAVLLLVQVNCTRWLFRPNAGSLMMGLFKCHWNICFLIWVIPFFQ